MTSMRVLDLDADFFLERTAHFKGRESERLDGDEYPAWTVGRALGYLRDRCGLTGRLPGAAVDHHGEVFGLWRSAIDAGHLVPPFRVVHLDGHADLGMGDAGWRYLLEDLVRRELADRRFPREGESHLGDGNYLAFAIANRWIAELDYVYASGGGDDALPYLIDGYKTSGDYIQLPSLDRALHERLMAGGHPELPRSEPPVPYRQVRWEAFTNGEGFDAIYLARSPEFTPPTVDAVFDAIRDAFIDQAAWPPLSAATPTRSRRW
jgi:UPF0489 domain